MNNKTVSSLFVLFAIVSIGMTAAPSAFAAHSMNATVENAEGSSTPGCEPDCFIPATVTIGVGGQVTFANNDAAAHTSTSGTAADGPDGVWDSSLVMMGSAYTTPALDAGEYPYFCMVHPWMEGLVIVTDDHGSSSQPSTNSTSTTTTPEPIELIFDLDKYLIAGFNILSDIRPSKAPTFTVSPSFTEILSKVPSEGAGTSTFTLSVSNSTTGSSEITLSP